MRPPAARVAVGTALAALLCSAQPAPAARRGQRAPRRTPQAPKLLLPPDASLHDRQVGEVALRALGKSTGAVVAMDPYTGRVLALVNPAEGLFRAYQPCSVFKVVVAVAGLSEGVIHPDTTYSCTKGCWMWPGHGPIDLRRALATSCNPFFEWVGEELGYAKVERYARLLGLGEVSGINLTGETPGRVPQSVPASRVGHVSSHAAGVSTSAVQLAVLLSATVNGGVVYQPQLAPERGFTPKERWRLPPGTVVNGLAEGFLSAVNEGSAASAFDPDVVVAGKTGTCSQLGWFASYAPAERPEIVVVVLLRHGSGNKASAVAGRIYQDLYKPAPPTAGGS